MQILGHHILIHINEQPVSSFEIRKYQHLTKPIMLQLLLIDSYSWKPKCGVELAVRHLYVIKSHMPTFVPITITTQLQAYILNYISVHTVPSTQHNIIHVVSV